MLSCLLAAPARADDATSVDPVAQPRLPAPFVLPELAHPRTDVGLSWTAGRGTPDGASEGGIALALVRATVEGSVDTRRRIYVGVTSDYAAALQSEDVALYDDTTGGAPARGVRHAFGNLEPHLRGVFPLTPSLACGFGVGGVLPTASFDRNGPTPLAVLAASSIEPTEYVHFLPGRFAARPFADVRVIDGAFVFQARQGLDVTIDEPGIDRARTSGRILAHAGVMPSRALELSVEATQIYFFYTDEPLVPPDPSLPEAARAAIQKQNAARERYRISDDRRTALTVGPAARLSFPDVDIGVAAVTNLFAPLAPAMQDFVALRFSLVAHLR